jgi:outer membrane lipoprotein-sorting protein
MKILLTNVLLGVVLALLAGPMWAESADTNGLERVLAQMDAAAKNFHTAEASLTSNQYTKVVDETDTQKGKVYFQRRGKEVEMAADITEPDRQYALYANGKAQLYNPKIDQVNEYNTDKNRAQVEAFLLLGFGGGGHELLATYDVKYLGTETVNGIAAAKLELLPKSKELRNNVARILLWLDPARAVSVQQQMFFPGGDYRLATYSGIQINQKLPDHVFKLKTTGKTKFVAPPK